MISPHTLSYVPLTLTDHDRSTCQTFAPLIQASYLTICSSDSPASTPALLVQGSRFNSIHFHAASQLLHVLLALAPSTDASKGLLFTVIVTVYLDAFVEINDVFAHIGRRYVYVDSSHVPDT
jgi:hypothetical protein